MRLAVIANHDGKRVIRWRGIFTAIGCVLLIAAPVYLLAYWLVSGGWPSVGPSLVMLAIAIGAFTGGLLSRAYSVPLDKLPKC